MKLRIVLLALATCLFVTETSNAQRGGRGGGGRGGFGGGGRGGIGIGIGVYPGGYGYGGYRGYGGYGYGGYGNGYYYPNTYYGPSSSYYYDPAYPSSNYIVPASNAVNAPGGMQITEIADDGPARKSALRSGDIITAVGGSRVESFEDLQRNLASANGDVEVSFLAGGTMKPEKTKVHPKNGKIGVTVVFTYLP